MRKKNPFLRIVLMSLIKYRSSIFSLHKSGGRHRNRHSRVRLDRDVAML